MLTILVVLSCLSFVVPSEIYLVGQDGVFVRCEMLHAQIPISAAAVNSRIKSPLASVADSPDEYYLNCDISINNQDAVIDEQGYIFKAMSNITYSNTFKKLTAMPFKITDTRENWFGSWVGQQSQIFSGVLLGEYTEIYTRSKILDFVVGAICILLALIIIGVIINLIVTCVKINRSYKKGKEIPMQVRKNIKQYAVDDPESHYESVESMQPRQMARFDFA
ncbi:hypothetical protein [Carp edema virus]|nr:hypothetical protein [Carp edema virus]